MAYRTILEKVRDNEDELLFRSEAHRVFAAVDAYPRLPLQCLVASFDGFAEPTHFNSLPRPVQRKMLEVGLAVGEKLLSVCTEDQMPVTHIEGRNINNHPHIVMFVAEQKEGQRLYDGTNLGPVAMRKTLEVMRFTPEEEQDLEARLAEISYYLF